MVFLFILVIFHNYIIIRINELVPRLSRYEIRQYIYGRFYRDALRLIFTTVVEKNFFTEKTLQQIVYSVYQRDKHSKTMHARIDVILVRIVSRKLS